MFFRVFHGPRTDFFNYYSVEISRVWIASPVYPCPNLRLDRFPDSSPNILAFVPVSLIGICIVPDIALHDIDG
jgi:hypothetical protein